MHLNNVLKCWLFCVGLYVYAEVVWSRQCKDLKSPHYTGLHKPHCSVLSFGWTTLRLRGFPGLKWPKCHGWKKKFSLVSQKALKHKGQCYFLFFMSGSSLIGHLSFIPLVDLREAQLGATSFHKGPFVLMWILNFKFYVIAWPFSHIKQLRVPHNKPQHLNNTCSFIKASSTPLASPAPPGGYIFELIWFDLKGRIGQMCKKLLMHQL